MTFSITSFVRTYCLCAFLLCAALAAQGKEKIKTPNKRTEGIRSRSIPTLHVPWVSPHHPLLSKPSLPLSLDPIRFTLHADKPTVAVGEEVQITITAHLLDIPASAFFIFEEQKSFSVKLLLPQGFTQTGGDYQEYMGAQLSSQNKTFTKRIRGIFTSIPENPCFALLRGAYHANASSVFEQKQVLCLSKKNTPKATRVADCTTPVLTPISPQTICYGGGFYMVSTSVTNGVEVYYQWYNDNGSANNNTNPIAGEERANLRSFPTAPGVYKYKIVVTSAGNSSCSASQSVTLTVNAPPTISSTTGTNPSCTPIFGGTISVVGAGGSALLYSKDDGGTWVDLTGINAQDEITRNTMLYTTVNDVARVKITLAEGFGLGPGGEYKGEIRNETTTPVFDGLAAGTYKIRVKNENGCISEPASVTLTNPNAPTIFNVTGGGTCVANGAPINLSGSSTGVNYSLLRNGVVVTSGVAGTGSALSFGNHTTEGTYTVTATNTTTNCSAQMNNNVVISTGTPPAAPVNIGGDKLFCAANATILEVSVAGGQTADWYAAATGGTPLNQGVGVTSFAPPTAGIYYVETRDITTQCKSTTRTPVTLLAAPTLSITGNTEIGCGNTSSLLNAHTSAALPIGASVSYAWKNNPSGPVLATTDTLRVTSAGTYTLTLTYGSCALTASQTVSSTIATDPSATLSSSARIACSGGLSIVPTLSNTTASTVYEWSGPNGFTANTANIEVTQAGTYTLAVKKNATTPCNTQEIFVDEKPTIPQDPSLTATRLSIDPENSTTLLARGCSALVSWSYISNDPPAESLNGFVAGSNTSTSVTLENTSPNLTLTYQDTPFQTSATYTAACVGECETGKLSVPITIFRNICGIKVFADQNAVKPNTPVTLVALLCSASNITWSTGQTGTQTITVTPSATTTYFAVCKLPSTGASCSSSVEIKVSNADCPSNFTITASATNIQKGDMVTLTANGCTGSLTWSNGVQQSTTIKVFPTDNVRFYAACTQDGNTCYSNTVSIQTQTAACLSGLYYDKTYLSTNIFGKSKWSTTVFPLGCQNGTLHYSHQGTVKQAQSGGYSYALYDIEGSVTVTATCTMPDGTTCSKELTIAQPSKDCNNLTLGIDAQRRITVFSNGSPSGEYFILTDDTGKQLNQTASTSVKVPISVKDRVYTATLENGCRVADIVKGFNFKLYTNPGLQGDMFDISKYANDPGSSYQLTIYPDFSESYNTCTGQMIWTNDQDPTFRYEGSDLIFKNSQVVEGGTRFLPMPSATTTYYATCYQNGVAYPATNAKTLVVNNLGGCLTLTRDAWQITHGNSVTLKASGCLGQITWSFNSLTVGTGTALTHTPLLSSTPGNATYTASCTNPACSQTVTLKVLPCQLIVSAPKDLVKMAEPLLLSAQGCSGGIITWNTGETANSITVKPLTNTVYSASCVVNGQTLCQSNNLSVVIDNLAPADIECPANFSLSGPATFVKCNQTSVTITPSGCPAGSTVLWQNTTTKAYNETYTFTPQTTITVTAVCVSPYGEQYKATASITITGINKPSASPSEIYGGYPAILRASGCLTDACTEGTYKWTNTKTNSIFYGSSLPVKLSENTTYTITCVEGGETIILPVTIKETDCRAINGCDLSNATNSNQEGITACHCDAKYPIYWYKLDYNGVRTEYTAGYNQRTIIVNRPPDKSGVFEGQPYRNPQTDTYFVYCANSQGKACSDAWTVFSPVAYTAGPTGTGLPPTNPDPCNTFSNKEKGKRIDYSGTITLKKFRLYSDWCPGTQVEWFLNGDKIANLNAPADYVDVPHTGDVYDYICTLAGGLKCQGSYEQPTPPARSPGDDERIGVNTSQAANDCPTSPLLNTFLSVELSTLICAHLELLKNPDGSMSSAKVVAFVTALKASVSSRYAASGITVSFPADDAPIIAAIMAQNCQSAGQLLAALNTASITATQFNSVKNATHQPILDDLKPVCDSRLAPADELVSSATGGRIGAYDIDYNRLFIAPDGRAVKLPVGATPRFFVFGVNWYPTPIGALEGFVTKENILYFAEINAAGDFLGYRAANIKPDLSRPLICPTVHDITNLYVSAPANSSVYYFAPFQSGNECGYKWIESTYTFSPTPGKVATLPILVGSNTNTTYLQNCDPIVQYLKASQLKNWLASKNLGKGAVYLANCNSGKVTLVTSTTESEQANLTPDQAKTKVLNRDFTTDFAIYACKQADGTWDITHNFKTGALAIPQGGNYTGTVAEVETRSNEAAQTVLQNNGVRGQTVDDELFYEELDIIKALVVVKDATLTLCNQAKVPEKFWDNNNADYPQAPFHGPTLSGVGDGAIAELKDTPELVGFGLEIATDPTKAKATWNGIKSMTPAKVKKMLLGAAADKIAKYTAGGNTMKHEAGKDGVQMAMFVVGAVKSIGTNAAKIVSLEGDVVNKLDELTDETLEATSNAVEETTGKEINKALKEGNTDGVPVDPAVIENTVIDVTATSVTKGRKHTWPELKALWKRGNDFNTKARNSLWYQFNEVWLEHPTKVYPVGHKNADQPMRFRLDSYDNGQIVSRKATTLSEIQQSTFEKYLKELVDKYPVGSKIANPNIGSTLTGNFYLEIPDINANFPNLPNYRAIASNFSHNGQTYNIQIILKPE